jgi:hypothetical protein
VTSTLGDGAWCSACRRQNSLSARFCRFCGARIDIQAAQPGAEAIPPSHEQQPPYTGPATVTSARFYASAHPPATTAPSPAEPGPPGPPPRPPGDRFRSRRGGSHGDRQATSRRVVTVVSAVAGVVAVLALAGWLAHWPGAVFGAKVAPVAQVGAATGARSSSAAAGSAASSPALSSTPAAPDGSASTSVSPAASPAAPVSSSAPTVSAPPAAPPGSGPVATVRAYFAAISAKNYTTAWRLGGDNLGVSYQSYAAGFTGTASDAVTVLSVTGDTVAARVTATQANGTVKIFQGTYTVGNGAITAFDVRQIS